MSSIVERSYFPTKQSHYDTRGVSSTVICEGKDKSTRPPGSIEDSVVDLDANTVQISFNKVCRRDDFTNQPLPPKGGVCHHHLKKMQ